MNIGDKECMIKDIVDNKKINERIDGEDIELERKIVGLEVIESDGLDVIVDIGDIELGIIWNRKCWKKGGNDED